jgi:hypothetical protein
LLHCIDGIEDFVTGLGEKSEGDRNDMKKNLKEWREGQMFGMI